MHFYKVIVRITDDDYGCIYHHADSADDAGQQVVDWYKRHGIAVTIYRVTRLDEV